MAIKGKIKACRIDYETKDKTVWKATILAYNAEDALNYIRKIVPTFDRHTGTSVLAEIDAIENSVFEDFFVSKVVEEPKPEAKETVGETTEIPANSEEPKPKCPWCRKEFANNVTLGNHIKKFHLDK